MTYNASPSKEKCTTKSDLSPFVYRHLGPRPRDEQAMLEALGYSSLEELIQAVIPSELRTDGDPTLPDALSEEECLAELQLLAERNQSWRSLQGLGYQAAIMPTVIVRNVFKNPGWYTQYTPYQAEISQGRLEALLNFQTLVSDLTGLPVANASLLDEGTAAAEAMTLALRSSRKRSTEPTILVDRRLHPQTLAVISGRAEPLGITVEPIDLQQAEAMIATDNQEIFALLAAYPGTEGDLTDLAPILKSAREQAVFGIVCADLFSLINLASPASMGAQICIGSSQRFGLPMGFGGPHAGYMATEDSFKRQLPGRIVGVSHDRSGRQALRLALQTREQHIRRDKATSNICTAQALPAVLASMYAVYHGADGLSAIAARLHTYAKGLAESAEQAGWKTVHRFFFDTVCLEAPSVEAVSTFRAKLAQHRIYVRQLEETPSRVVIALDERTTPAELDIVVEALGADRWSEPGTSFGLPGALLRSDEILEHENFRRYRSETEMLRYLKRLENRDLSLTHSMIPLGSCTMKLNATTEMIPITWPGFGDIHPAAPAEQVEGYLELLRSCEELLCEVTGFHALSLQPNAGSQGEYAGLLAIRAYHRSQGEPQRNKVLIPVSAHGTNPASAVLAGFETVGVKCDDQGNIDVEHLKQQAEAHSQELGAIMVTYPSTHGVFEHTLLEVIDIVHRHGGQVYLDGANFNAMVGWVRPGRLGADVAHLNLHKTFCIPHGGGGPGMGPIGVAEHLAPFLPRHPLAEVGGSNGIAPVSAAPWGSASLMPIVWGYLRMMGTEGLRRATAIAILNANYIAQQLSSHYSVLYTDPNGRVAHECILDLRPWKAKSGIEVEDVAKRLVDYSFHAPTMSWPVAGTLMVEPTESEGKEEIDRFIEAMRSIAEEQEKVASGEWDRSDNPLKMSPHTAEEACGDEWAHPYGREAAVFPRPELRNSKFWPSVARIDNAAGDRNLVCSCAGWDPEL